MQNDWIIITDYCDKCHIEPSFIDLLEENGLIDLRHEDDGVYLCEEQLPDVERYSRLYYDLDINMEGIDVISNLLRRMEDMLTAYGFMAKCIDGGILDVWKD